MANYKIAAKITFEKEGGYVNRKEDKGGETIYGISRRYHSSWEGWSIVDQTKAFCTEEEGTREYEREMTDHLKHNNEIHRLKETFYKKNFWDVLKLDSVEEQKIANAIFDASVNHDPRDAAKMAQRALGISADGIIGKKSIAALNEVYPPDFLRGFTKQRCDYYQSIANNDPSQVIFLGGWLKRAESFNV